MAGVSAFRRAYAETDTLDTTTFASYDARRLRYQIFWSFVESTAYSKTHMWADSLKTEYGLYEYTRNIYNPAFRVATFWATHLMGGSLDALAGDGKAVASALPIITPQAATVANADRLRVALSQLWRDSNWETNKDIFTLYGNVMGDVGLRVIDDIGRGKAYLNVVHPGTIKSVEMDEFGHVKGYVLEERRLDPRTTIKDDPLGKIRTTGQPVKYNEVVTRDGVNVIYETFLDGSPYAWPEHRNRKGNPVSQWEEPYGFVPLVMVKHINIGLDWGWAECQPTLPKIREVDDLASKLDDQVRKSVDAKWAFLNTRKPSATPTVGGRSKSAENDEPGREEEGAIYLDGPGADVKPMIAPVDIGQVSAHILTILESIEQDHPELNKALYAPQASAMSGRAIRLVRQPVEEKAQSYRPHYDNGLVRAQQMAMAIGGFRGYKGYQGFGLESFNQGLLEHSIGKRPVFSEEPLDRLELKQVFYTVLGLAGTAGTPAVTALADLGWTQDQIDEYQKAKADQSQAAAPQSPLNAVKPALDKALADLAAAMGAPPVGGNGTGAIGG